MRLTCSPIHHADIPISPSVRRTYTESLIVLCRMDIHKMTLHNFGPIDSPTQHSPATELDVRERQ